MCTRYESSGRTVPVWRAAQAVPPFSSLARDESADVCIVGGGVAGLSTAYHLAREGRTVIVVDDGPILCGETERTTAHLASALDDRFCELEKFHGETGAHLAGQSHSAAIDRVEEIVAREKIDCDFLRVDGYLFMPEGESLDLLSRELAAAQRAGLVVSPVERAPLTTFDTGPALRFERQAQFDPIKYLTAIAQAIIRDGGTIFSHTHVTKVHDGSRPSVETQDGHVISARAIVFATNSPVIDRVTLHTKQAPYRTYVIAAAIPRDSVPLALYWDTAEPYHYVRLQHSRRGEDGEPDVLIVGGEDHKTGQCSDPGECFRRLEGWTRERFRLLRIEHRWSGQVMEPVDSLSFIGHNPGQENVFIVTGDSGHGMTHGTIAGMLLTDLIMDRKNPWAELYDPSRKPHYSALGKFARENLNVAKQYGDYLTSGDLPDEAQLSPDSGAVIRHHGKKVAIYCDKEGHHHECSAVCPHLGCIVVWNSVEKTWDCPCHGSRFGPYGEVLNGPANTPLQPHHRAVPPVSPRPASRPHASARSSNSSDG